MERPGEWASTDNLPMEERLPFWNNLSSKLVAPLRVEPKVSNFLGTMHRVPLRRSELYRIQSSPARVTGGHENRGFLNLQVQHSGSTHNKSAGRCFSLFEGDLAIFDPSDEIVMDFEDDADVIVIKLPLADIEQRLPRLKKLCGLRVHGSAGAGALASHFFRQAWTAVAETSNVWTDQLEDVIWPMLAVAFAGELLEEQTLNVRDARRHEVFALIEQIICDPDLGVHMISGRTKLSVRYVQLLFADVGTSPSTYICERRLDLARERIDKEGRQASISTIAYELGFNDLSAFCRAFRRRFQLSPREYRSGARKAAKATSLSFDA